MKRRGVRYRMEKVIRRERATDTGLQSGITKEKEERRTKEWEGTER